MGIVSLNHAWMGRVQDVYLSVDPGSTNTGIAVWNINGECLDVGQLKREPLDEYMIEKLPEFLKHSWILEIFIEEYRVDPSKIAAHYQSKVETVQVIGQWKMFAKLNKIPIKEQRRTCKYQAAKWAQVKVNRDRHLPDWQSAYLIGYYEMFRKGLIEPKVLSDNA